MGLINIQDIHTFMHASMHTHRAHWEDKLILQWCRGLHTFFFSPLLSFLSFFLYSISFLHFASCSYHTFMGRRMDGWMYSNKPRGGWLHTKDMAVHVWTGVDVEIFVCWLLTSLVVIFFSSLPFCFFLMSCLM